MPQDQNLSSVTPDELHNGVEVWPIVQGDDGRVHHNTPVSMHVLERKCSMKAEH